MGYALVGLVPGRGHRYSHSPEGVPTGDRLRHMVITFVRVHHAEYVDGTMKNGVSINELMETLGADSFKSTQQNAARGERNINPRAAYGQQPQVQLSAE